MSQVSPEDFAQIKDAVHEFIRTRVVPREREIADTDAIPDDIRQAAKDIGLFGYAIPQEWGGLGLDLTQDVELAMEFGYTALALRSMFGTNNGIAGQVLVNFGTDEQKGQWLEGIASGDVVASFALTEPGAGSNPAGLRTKAVQQDDGDWVIDGAKCFITNAALSNLLVTFARVRPADENGPGIGAFLIPTDTPGVTVAEHDEKMGQQGAWTSDVHYDGVRVPASALVGGDVDSGYKAAMTSLARGRVHIAALSVGSAQRALDESLRHAAVTTQGALPSATSSWSKPTWPTCRPGSWPDAHWSATPPRSTCRARTGASRRRSRRCSAPRWSVRWPTRPSRSTAAAATCAK